MNKVLITGYGFVIGGSNNADDIWNKIKNKNLMYEDVLLKNDVKIRKGKEIDLTKSDYGIPEKQAKHMDKQIIYSLIAAKECVSCSKYDDELENEQLLNNTGVVMGSMFAQVEFGMEQVKKVVVENSSRISAYTGMAFYFGSNVGEVSVMLKTKGENCAITSGSNIGIDAIMKAYSMIKREDNEVVFAGAGENVNFDIFYNALLKLNKLSSSGYTPYDRNSNGALITNGAGLLCIESEKSALKRNANVYGEVVGFSTLNVPSCMFSLNKEIIDYTYKVIIKTLRDCDMDPKDIDLIIPTADGLRDGDLYESIAIKKIFRNRKDIIYTPKPTVGYALSFNSIVDVFAGLMIMKDNEIPGHPREYNTTDSEFNEMLVGVNPLKRNINNILILHRSWMDGRVSALIVRRYKR